MKIELHAHTSEVSPCSGISAADIISGYHNAGYDAVVITDHFNFYVLEGFNIDNETDRVKRYMLGYELARKAAAKYGMKAILGIEVCLRHEKGGDLCFTVSGRKHFALTRIFMITPCSSSGTYVIKRIYSCLRRIPSAEFVMWMLQSLTAPRCTTAAPDMTAEMTLRSAGPRSTI